MSTKEKLLDTAEKLFAEKGYDATSLRQIIAEAGVNLAAIHYHFGSKEELLDEVVVRHVGPVNDERLAQLDCVEAEAGKGRPALEQVVKAFLAPTARVAAENPQFVRLMGRLHADGVMQPILQRNFQPVIARFLTAMRNALPDLPPEEFRWRVHFMIGAMAHTMCCSPTIPCVAAEPADFGRRLDLLVTFLSGGFRAPATDVSGR
jgi:AcrR family transcriptional regulator